MCIYATKSTESTPSPIATKNRLYVRFCRRNTIDFVVSTGDKVELDFGPSRGDEIDIIGDIENERENADL